MTQHGNQWGPRDLESVLAARYTLTDKGLAATEQIVAEQRNQQHVTPHPGHALTVTRGPFGRAYVDCACGVTRTCPNKRAANVVALRHHHEVGGCNCPPHIVASPIHEETL